MIMEVFIVFFSVGSLVGLCVLAWFRTKSGKKWLASL